MLLNQVNSFVSCESDSVANNHAMSTRSSAENISKTPEEDAARLRPLMENLTVSQADFAANNGIGTQAQIWQYLNPDNKKGRPLNISAAIGFAKGLNKRVSDFSPSLQAVIDKISCYASQTPQHMVNEDRAPYVSLSPQIQKLVEMMQTVDVETQNKIISFARFAMTESKAQNSKKRAG